MKSLHVNFFRRVQLFRSKRHPATPRWARQKLAQSGEERTKRRQVAAKEEAFVPDLDSEDTLSSRDNFVDNFVLAFASSMGD